MDDCSLLHVPKCFQQCSNLRDPQKIHLCHIRCIFICSGLFLKVCSPRIERSFVFFWANQITFLYISRKLTLHTATDTNQRHQFSLLFSPPSLQPYSHQVLKFPLFVQHDRCCSQVGVKINPHFNCKSSPDHSRVRCDSGSVLALHLTLHLSISSRLWEATSSNV